MKLALVSLGLFGLLLLTGCDGDGTDPHGEAGETISQSNARQESSEMGYWRSIPRDSLWKAIQLADGYALLGIKNPGSQGGVIKGELKVSPATFQMARVLSRRIKDVEIVKEFTLIPAFLVRMQSRESLDEVLDYNWVEYVEPAVEPSQASRPSSNSPSRNYLSAPSTWLQKTVYPGDVIWSRMSELGVTSAWNVADGAGVKVAVIGTGVSMNVPQLNAQFRNGLSNVASRTIERYEFGDWPNPEWHDTNGHETRIIGTIAAPRDGISMSGIAYRASIASIKIDNDVILGSFFSHVGIYRAVDGIEKAVAVGADIANMAFGTTFWYDSVQDAVEIAYASGLMLVGAAGTGSICNTGGQPLFPARLPEMETVGMIGDDGQVVCPNGVEFSFPQDGAFGFDDQGIYDYESTNGSSFATSVFSGMAALIMSKGYSRDQTRAMLLGSRGYSGFSDWRVPNVARALKLVTSAEFSGPSLVTRNGTYTWTSSNIGLDPNDPSARYQWSVGGISLGSPIDSTQRSVNIPVVRTAGPDRVMLVSLVLRQESPGFFPNEERPQALFSRSVTVKGLSISINGPTCVTPRETVQYSARPAGAASPYSVAIQTMNPCPSGGGGPQLRPLAETCGVWSNLSTQEYSGTTYGSKYATTSFWVRAVVTDPDVFATSWVLPVEVSTGCGTSGGV